MFSNYFTQNRHYSLFFVVIHQNCQLFTKLSKNDVTSSNRFDHKFYKIKKIAKNSQFLTNSVAIPNHKDFLTSIRIEEISLN